LILLALLGILALVLSALNPIALWHNPIVLILLGIFVASFHFWLRLYLAWHSYQRILHEKRHGIWDLIRLTNKPVRHILQTKCYHYLHQERYLLYGEIGLQTLLAFGVWIVLDTDIVIRDDWLHVGVVTMIMPALALLDITLGLILSMAFTLVIRSTSFVGFLLISLHIIVWSGGLSLSWLVLLSHELSIALFALVGLGVTSYLILLWLGLVGIWMIDSTY
jgi:hypothetical protein